MNRMNFTDEQELRIKAVLAGQLDQAFITDRELTELECRAFDMAADRLGYHFRFADHRTLQ